MNHGPPAANHFETGDVRSNVRALGSHDEKGLARLHVTSERIRDARHEHTSSAADVKHVFDFEQELHRDGRWMANWRAEMNFRYWPNSEV